MATQHTRPTRSPATRSMQVWVVYVFAVGAGLALAPNAILGLIGLPETSEAWIRVVGVVVIALGILYVSMLRRDDHAGFRATVYERWFVAAALGVLAVTTGIWQISIFALIDLLGGIWTFLALRASPKGRSDRGRV